MRIIAGKYKGRHIRIPSNFNARPTTDFAREGIFNVMNNHYNLDEIRFLDLFSGSGAFIYEMISRGAIEIVAVEQNPAQAAFISSQAEELLAPAVKVFNSDALAILGKMHQQFNIIFADPPFDTDYYSEIHHIVFENQLLRPGGLLILEHNKHHNLSEKKHFLELRKYGAVHFSIFENPMD
jgi:16S rRNA (guanine966-N2)-methyltransferase